MKITALLENDRLPHRSDLVAEHGVSLHIEWGDRSLLFDTGATEAFAENARRLGVSLRGVTHAVLSHYHYDHGGGLARFLSENTQATVFLRPPPAGKCVARVLGGLFSRDIDIDRSLLSAYPERFAFLDERREVAKGAHVLTDIPRRRALPSGNKLLFLKQGQRVVPDPFEHELLLVLEGAEGLVVFTGCSHRGILNMLDAVADAFPGAPIQALFGGFHLIGLPVINTLAGSSGDVEALAMQLAERSILRIFTFHCTGPKGFRILAGVLGDRLAAFPTGSTVEL